MTFREIAEQPIQFVKGVGPYFQELLAKKNIRSLLDLMTFFPRDYEDRTRVTSIREALAEPEKNSVVRVRIDSIESMTVNFRSVPKLIVSDGDMTAELPLFAGRMPKGAREGAEIHVVGKFRFGRNAVWCSVTEVEFDADASLTFGRIVPLYELTAGLSQKKMRSLIQSQLPLMRTISYDISPEAKGRYSLMSFGDALAEIHFPRDMKRMEQAKRTLIYEEFLAFQVMYLRENRPPVLAKEKRYHSMKLRDDIAASLPYRLTRAQDNTLAEISDDMLSDRQMFRLLQGDVGSGKTVVAFLAALIAAEAGYQTALLAPTEILAAQHMRTIQGMAGDRISVGLLTGSLSGEERARMLSRCAANDVRIIVGTHALLSDDVRFASLGLAVIDEQQRFGVAQRNALLAKGKNVDYLLMTATPIPRSLAMTLFGELDLSVIDEMPSGRKGIRTKYVGKDARDHCYRFLKNRIEKGEQGYVVFPLIEETADSDLLDLTNEYERVRATTLSDVPLAVVHGRMTSVERDDAMGRFSRGEVKVLFATSIIEVGIDNPNATTMVIEGAERFGLSQLHQMRGRVGRGDREGFCYLVHHGELTDAASKRLAVLADSNDGFRIAEEDLAIRGPGEFIGMRQAGLPEFRLGDIIRDVGIMREARTDALALCAGTDRLAPEFEERIARMTERLTV